MKLNNILLTFLLVFFCMSASAQQKSEKQKGKATYYSKRATGARTASGERLHHDSMTCAHRFYPFGTLLKVRNVSNGKEVVVRVNDRGPFRRGLIIDLSWSAAKAIGMLSAGIQMVEVEQVDDNVVPYKVKEENLVPQFEFADVETDYLSPIDFSGKKAKSEKKHGSNSENAKQASRSHHGEEKKHNRR